MPRIPTQKQRDFIAEYIKTKNKTLSAQKAYGIKNKNTAYSVAASNLKSPVVRNNIREILNSLGMSDNESVDYLKKIINAGTTNKALSKATPDHALRGLENVFKLKDQYPNQKLDITQNSISVQLRSKSNQELEQELDNTIVELNKFKVLLGNDKSNAIEGEATQ